MTYKLKKPITKRKLNYLIKDEEKGIREYQKLGLFDIARDEKKHLKKLKHLRVFYFGKSKKKS